MKAWTCEAQDDMEAADREGLQRVEALGNLHDRNMWRSGVRYAIRAASQLPGRWPTDVDLPLYLHVNQKSDYDDDMMIFSSPELCCLYFGM